MKSVILVALTFALAACGGTEDVAKPENGSGAAVTTTATGPIGLAALDAWIAKHPVGEGTVVLPCPLYDVRLDPSKRYLWTLETNRGSMVFEMFSDWAPTHVLNFAYLSRVGFFEDVTFHRIISGFMAQGGDPKGDGTGGPGYEFGGEFAAGNPNHAERGMLSMANAGEGTDGSQFFITFGPQQRLNGKHTVFGRLVEGQETLDRIEKAASSDGTPRMTVRIVKATMVEVERG
ncbi:MAG: peptidylprolyl isomerase [Planctomycetes bacterium]|nr:peptidylprolyl isomerase [Planctomycetota bacterium]